jgi:hypothetical protein
VLQLLQLCFHGLLHLTLDTCAVPAHQGQDVPHHQQQWNPYNATTADSRSSRHSASAQPSADPAAAAAATAAAANSSGLSEYALQQQQRGRHHRVGLPDGLGSSTATETAWGSQSGQHSAVSAALHAVLLSQHDVALEQFSSLQEALEYLEQQDQQDSLVGLAAEDYGHKQQKQQMRRHWQDGQIPGMYVRRNSIAGRFV